MGAVALSLRAGQETVIHCVMPLGNCSMRCSTSCIRAVVGKGWAIPCEACLAANRFLAR